MMIKGMRRPACWLRNTIATAIVLACDPGCNSPVDSQRGLEPNSVSPSDPDPADRVAAPSKSAIKLQNMTADTGISFVHTDGNCGKFYVVELAASGLATFDFDNDGLMDIYFLSGTPLRGAPPDAPAPGNALYRNLGGFHFQDM